MTALDDAIEAALQASRDLFAKHSTPCDCWQRVPGDQNVLDDKKPMWHLCDYHEGYEDALRATEVRAVVAEASRQEMLAALGAEQVGSVCNDPVESHGDACPACRPIVSINPPRTPQ